MSELTADDTENVQVAKVYRERVRRQSAFRSRAEEISPNLEVPKLLHVCFASVHAAARLVDPNNVDWVFRAAAVFATKVRVEALGAENDYDIYCNL